MKKSFFGFVLILGSITLAGSCKNADKDATKEQSGALQSDSALADNEKLYRPNFHFTPQKGWTNDPNGMFYYNGYYHLYFQHYPDSTVWGPMHWGHAISTDLVSWREQPIALYPDELGYIFSGSAVVDIENTSGFSGDGEIPIVAMFTHHDMEADKAGEIKDESQSIAYSLNEGLSYTKYEDNPVIENPEIPDFRDPKVNWDDERKQWVMALAAGQEIKFYSSKNLKNWQALSTFGEGIGNHDGVWECPDLFPLQVQGTEETKWVLLVSINPGGPNGGSATQYFIGDFDGTYFLLDPNFEKQLKEEHDFWVDFGKDNYAGVTWSNAASKDNGRYFMGWMSNWQYANEVPTDAWRGAMTVAREVKLIKTPESYRLAFEPVEQLKGYRTKKFQKKDIAVEEEIELIGSEKIDLSKAEVKFEIPNPQAGFKYILSNREGDSLVFGYRSADHQFFVDRSQAGRGDFSEEFAKRPSEAPKVGKEEGINGTIILDKTSLELFYNDGTTVMTEIFFPNAPFESLSIAPEDEEFTLGHIEIHEFNFN